MAFLLLLLLNNSHSDLWNMAHTPNGAKRASVAALDWETAILWDENFCGPTDDRFIHLFVAGRRKTHRLNS